MTEAGAGRSWTTRDAVATGILALAYVIWATQKFWGRDAVDLWPMLAVAHFYDAGAFDQIYPSGAVFDLGTPSAWRAHFDARFGVGSDCFPFVYPPLWAWLAAKLVPLLDDRVWLALPFVANPLLAVGCTWCTWRATGATMNPLRWFGVCLGLLTLSTPLYFALDDGQAQVLVTFLVLASVERSRARDGRTAGGLLALAASIKLYPLVFVGIWVARRDWRAVGSFVVCGLALGLLSIAVAGPALHLVFLDTVRAIGGTLFHHPINHSLEVALASVLHLLGFEGLAPANPDVLAALAKPTWLLWSGRAVLAGVIAGIAVAAARADEASLYSRVWPVSLLLIAVTAPLAWSYYLLAGLFFLPLLFQDVRTGAIASVLWVVISPFGVVIRLWGAARAQQIAVALAALGFAFLFARRPQR